MDHTPTVLDRKRKSVVVDGRNLEIVEPPGRVFREIMQAQSRNSQEVSIHAARLSEVQSKIASLNVGDPNFLEQSEKLARQAASLMMESLASMLTASVEPVKMALNWKEEQVDDEFLENLAPSQLMALGRIVNEVVGIDLSDLSEASSEGNGVVGARTPTLTGSESGAPMGI